MPTLGSLNKDVKATLTQAHLLKLQIKIFTQQIQELERLEEQVRGSKGDSSPLQQEVKQLNGTVEDFVVAYEEVKSLIFQVEGKELQTLLLLRYLKGDSWPVVAEKMNYSMSGIYYKHLQALNQMAFLLEEDRE